MRKKACHGDSGRLVGEVGKIEAGSKGRVVLITVGKQEARKKADREVKEAG